MPIVKNFEFKKEHYDANNEKRNYCKVATKGAHCCEIRRYCYKEHFFNVKKMLSFSCLAKSGLDAFLLSFFWYDLIRVQNILYSHELFYELLSWKL